MDLKSPLSSLYLAALTSNTPLIRTILTTIPNISILSSSTPRQQLHLTPCTPTDSLITFILSSSITLTLTLSPNRKWTTVLHHAIETSNLPLLHLALSCGANPNQRNWAKNTPLHTAALTSLSDAAETLLNFGADIHAMNLWGRTPLQDARRRKRGEEGRRVIWLLLENETPSYEDQDGRPLWHLAAQYGHVELLMMLVDAGVDVDRTDGYGRTVLHAAAKVGSVEMVGFLVGRGADWRVVDDFGRRAGDMVPVGEGMEEMRRLLGGEVGVAL